MPMALSTRPNMGNLSLCRGSTRAEVLQAQATPSVAEWFVSFPNSSFDSREVNGVWRKYFLRKSHKSPVPLPQVRIISPHRVTQESHSHESPLPSSFLETPHFTPFCHFAMSTATFPVWYNQKPAKTSQDN